MDNYTKFKIKFPTKFCNEIIINNLRLFWLLICFSAFCASNYLQFFRSIYTTHTLCYGVDDYELDLLTFYFVKKKIVKEDELYGISLNRIMLNFDWLINENYFLTRLLSWKNCFANSYLHSLILLSLTKNKTLVFVHCDGMRY